MVVVLLLDALLEGWKLCNRVLGCGSLRECRSINLRRSYILLVIAIVKLGGCRGSRSLRISDILGGFIGVDAPNWPVALGRLGGGGWCRSWWV